MDKVTLFEIKKILNFLKIDSNAKRCAFQLIDDEDCSIVDEEFMKKRYKDADDVIEVLDKLFDSCYPYVEKFDIKSNMKSNLNYKNVMDSKYNLKEDSNKNLEEKGANPHRNVKFAIFQVLMALMQKDENEQLQIYLNFLRKISESAYRFPLTRRKINMIKYVEKEDSQIKVMKLGVFLEEIISKKDKSD